MKGKKILKAMFQSFTYGNTDVYPIVAYYFLLDDLYWYKLSTIDGHNYIEIGNEEITQAPNQDIMKDNTTISYPIYELKCNFCQQTIVDIKEYAWKRLLSEMLGFYIVLENMSFSLLDDDESGMYYINGFFHKAEVYILDTSII